jgi:hypothetical protein
VQASPQNSSSTSGGLSDGALSGIVVGVVIPVIGIVVALLAWRFPKAMKSIFVHHFHHTAAPQVADNWTASQEITTIRAF